MVKKKKIISKKSTKKKSTKKKSKKKSTTKKPTKKTKKVSAIPAGYSAITPYLVVNDAASAIEFYKKAFGAKEKARMTGENNKVAHAELKIGDSIVMLADEHPECNAKSPKTVGGTPVSIHFYTKNVDKVVEQAIQAGALLIRDVADQFYGDRSGGVEDPFGHQWYVSTHVENVTPRQMKKRMENSKFA